VSGVQQQLVNFTARMELVKYRY